MFDAKQKIFDSSLQQCVAFALRSAADRAIIDLNREKKQGSRTFSGLLQDYIADEIDRVFRLGEYSSPKGLPDTAGLDILSDNIPPNLKDKLPSPPSFDIFPASHAGFRGWISDGCLFTVINCSSEQDIDSIVWSNYSEIRRDLARCMRDDSIQYSLLPPNASASSGGSIYRKLQEKFPFHSAVFIAYQATSKKGLLLARMGVPADAGSVGKAWAYYTDLDPSILPESKPLYTIRNLPAPTAEELGLQLRSDKSRGTQA